MHTHGRGYTLIEILITITVLTMIFAAAPPLTKTLQEMRQNSQLNEMLRLLEMTRSSAINSGHNATLCGSLDGVNCTKNWKSAAILVFEDRDNNHRADTNDRVIYRSQMPLSHWHWRGSNKPYLRFRADGTSIEWGHFTLCPMSKEIPYAWQITLNFVGRPYKKQILLQDLNANDSCG